MNILCLEYKIVDIPYFLDVMKTYEVMAILPNVSLSVKHSWDQTRNIMLKVIQPYLKRGVHLNITDMLKMPYDEEKSDGKKKVKPVYIEPTKELLEKMKKNAENQRDYLRSIGAIS